MAGVRRRLRDVGARVSGVLGALRDEVVPELLGGGASQPDEAAGEAAVDAPAAEATVAGAGVGDTGDVPDTTTAPTDALPADEVQADASRTDGVQTDALPAGAAAGPAAEQGPPALDEVCAAAVELARAAAVEEAGDSPSRGVGEHLGAEAEGATVVTHSFACTDPAYVGWRWAVTVARAEGSDVVTVDEVVLLPGSGALLAPDWVPYSERVQPDDLSPGDLLPPAPDDVRLVPACADPDALVEEVRWELGLGRPRVLSLEGRADAAERWFDGDTGPASRRAKAAPGRCGDCGFLVPLGGSLRAAFGACANAQAPDDGRVVALTHGCGAHSEQPVELTHAATAGLAVDDVEYDIEAKEPGEPAADQQSANQPGPDPEPGPADEQQAEELGHS